MSHLTTGFAASIPALAVLAAAGWWAFAAFPGAAEPPPKGDQPTHDEILGPATTVAADADKDLKHTRVVGALDTPHASGTSLVWCATMPVCWRELALAMNGAPGPLQVDKPDALTAALNAFPVAPADLDDASSVALGGLVRDGILDKIKEELKAKFKGAASPKLLPDKGHPDDIIAYAYLFKNLAFKTPLLKRESGFKFGQGSVKSFGIWNDPRAANLSDMRRQVSVLAYTDQSHWLAELKSTSPKDRLLIARLEPGATLAATVQAALAQPAGREPQEFNRLDELIVPNMNFDVMRVFRELMGLFVSGSKHQGTITDARQSIRFKLDERGAILKSEALLVVPTSAPITPKVEIKRLICDGPFLIMMMREGAQSPFFAAWVDNPELLESWK